MKTRQLWLPIARLSLPALLITCMIVGASFLLMDLESARWIQSYLGYYFCSAAFFCFLYFAYLCRDLFFNELNERIGRRCGIFAALIALVGTFLMMLHEPRQMRVFNDEPTHALTAAAMAQERAVHSPGLVYYESGTLVFANPDPVYRLYLYPYLVSLAHNLTGMRIDNLYWINAQIGFALLLVTFYLGFLLGGSAMAGYAAQLLLMGVPTLNQVLNSASYDPLNLLCLSCFAIACLLYLRDGGSRLLNLAISSGILLAYSRSESIIYLSVLALCFLLRSFKDRNIELSLYAIVSPVFLAVPFAARKISAQLSDSLPQFYGNIETGFFSLVYLRDNSREVFDWMFSIGSNALNPLLIIVLGLVAIVVAALLLGKKFILRNGIEKKQPDVLWNLFLFSLLGLGCVHLFLILCLYWDPTEASAVRFFLPITFIFILLIIRAGFWLGRHFSFPIFRYLAILAIGFFWVSTLPKAARAEITEATMASYYAERFLEWAKKNDDGRTLYAMKSGAYFALNGYPSVSLRLLSANPAAVGRLIQEGYYDQVLILNYTYFSPEADKWTQSYPIVPIADNLTTQRVDQWRGFIHGEAVIERVTGYKDEDGGSRKFKASDKANEALPEFSGDEYFQYIRSLHRMENL